MSQSQPHPEGLSHWSTEVELLTRRERQICSLVALGYTGMAIARRLEISHKTVETHRCKVMSKLGLRSRADLVRFALDHGLIGGGPGGGCFKCCTGCSVEWVLRGEFLSDPAVSFLGYHAVTRPPGFLFFNHDLCGTNLVLALEWFQELTDQPVLADSCLVTGNNEHCLASEELELCPLRCVCTCVWRISSIIRQWPKQNRAAA